MLNRNNQNRFNTKWTTIVYLQRQNKYHFMDIFVEHTVQSPISHWSIQSDSIRLEIYHCTEVEALVVLFFLRSSRGSFRRVIGIEDSVLDIRAPLVTACKYATIANGDQRVQTFLEHIFGSLQLVAYAVWSIFYLNTFSL